MHWRSPQCLRFLLNQAAHVYGCFLACTPQVFFMQAGFAMLSAGSVRAKNAKARVVAITLHVL